MFEFFEEAAVASDRFVASLGRHHCPFACGDQCRLWVVGRDFLSRSCLSVQDKVTGLQVGWFCVAVGIVTLLVALFGDVVPLCDRFSVDQAFGGVCPGDMI